MMFRLRGRMIAEICMALSVAVYARAEPSSLSETALIFGDRAAFSANSLPKAITVRTPQELASADDDAAGVPKVPPATEMKATVAPVPAPISAIAPYLRNHSPLTQVDALVVSPDFRALVPGTRAPLKSERDQRAVERDAMLPEADSIDGLANNRLGPWKARLDNNLEKLNEEAGRYSNDVSVHRSRCAPARDEQTWQWCQTNRKRLDAWDKDLRERGEAHNAELAKFHVESKPYDARVSVIVARIESWEAAVRALLRKISDALLRNTGSCTDEEFDPLDRAITENCKRVAAWSCDETQSCKVLLENMHAGQKCYDSRKALMDKCFNGGNEIHHGVLREVQNGIERCRRIFRQKCEEIGAAGSRP